MPKPDPQNKLASVRKQQTLKAIRGPKIQRTRIDSKKTIKKKIMTDKKLCRFCHATVEHHGMFCINCGAPIEEPSHGTRSPSALQTENALDEIAKLETLRDQGVITEVEFQEQRKELIATLTVNQSKQS
ncbi:MAG: SHOCT domain-containing protein [Halobacteriota archaeon]